MKRTKYYQQKLEKIGYHTFYDITPGANYWNVRSGTGILIANPPGVEWPFICIYRKENKTHFYVVHSEADDDEILFDTFEEAYAYMELI